MSGEFLQEVIRVSQALDNAIETGDTEMAKIYQEQYEQLLNNS